MLVVADATPLISLMKVGRLDLLLRLFECVLIPGAVYNELTTNTFFAGEARQIVACEFVRRVSVPDEKSVSLLQRATGLDLGESEAIVYAGATQADILLMDEAKGRGVAKKMGLTVMGTIGILLEAFYEKILTVEDIEDALIQLREKNRHISDQLIQYVREKIYQS